MGKAYGEISYQKEKKYNLETLLQDFDLKKKFLGFLTGQDCLQLRGVSRTFRYTLSSDFRKNYEILRDITKNLKIELKGFKTANQRLMERSMIVQGETLAFLLEKYVKLGKKPGSYLDKVVKRSNKVFEQVQNPTLQLFKKMDFEEEKSLKAIEQFFDNEINLTEESLTFMCKKLTQGIEVPRELAAARNEFFKENQTKLQKSTKTFVKKIKKLAVNELKNLILRMFPVFAEMTIMTKLLFQEASEVTSLLNFLVYKLQKDSMKLISLEHQNEDFKAEIDSSRTVKENLSGRNRLLERDLQEMSMRSTNLTEHIKVILILKKKSEKQLKTANSENKNLEWELKQLDERNQELELYLEKLEKEKSDLGAFTLVSYDIKRIIDKIFKDKNTENQIRKQSENVYKNSPKLQNL